MKNHGMNPYLPSWEYVPDGEPHVFGKRVYILSLIHISKRRSAA